MMIRTIIITNLLKNDFEKRVTFNPVAAPINSHVYIQCLAIIPET